MVKRLAELGLAEHEPYHGDALTKAGERVALEVIRHHRLIEAYLAEALGVPWDRVHDEAEVLEHYISEELEERIAAELGDPELRPARRSDPRPRAATSRTTSGVPLAELEPGERRIFTRVSDSDPAMLRYLERARDPAGRPARVTGREPFDGPLFVEAGGDRARARRRAAGAMRVGRGRVGSPMALADDFRSIVDSLPSDWTDIVCDLRITDESQYIDAAVLLSSATPSPTRRPSGTGG